MFNKIMQTSEILRNNKTNIGYTLCLFFNENEVFWLFRQK